MKTVRSCSLIVAPFKVILPPRCLESTFLGTGPVVKGVPLTRVIVLELEDWLASLSHSAQKGLVTVQEDSVASTLETLEPSTESEESTPPPGEPTTVSEGLVSEVVPQVSPVPINSERQPRPLQNLPPLHLERLREAVSAQLTAQRLEINSSPPYLAELDDELDASGSPAEIEGIPQESTLDPKPCLSSCEIKNDVIPDDHNSTVGVGQHTLSQFINEPRNGSTAGEKPPEQGLCTSRSDEAFFELLLAAVNDHVLENCQNEPPPQDIDTKTDLLWSGDNIKMDPLITNEDVFPTNHSVDPEFDSLVKEFANNNEAEWDSLQRDYQVQSLDEALTIIPASPEGIKSTKNWDFPPKYRLRKREQAEIVAGPSKPKKRRFEDWRPKEPLFLPRKDDDVEFVGHGPPSREHRQSGFVHAPSGQATDRQSGVNTLGRERHASWRDRPEASRGRRWGEGGSGVPKVQLLRQVHSRPEIPIPPPKPRIEKRKRDARPASDYIGRPYH